jgi:hypothetical protein
MGSPQATVHKVLLFSQLVVLITAGIALWIISLIALIRSAQTSFVVNDILSNWKTPFLSSVTILPAGSTSCPYQSFPLFNYSFPGTEAGCNCTGISKVGAALYKVDAALTTQSCGGQQLLAGCQNFSAIPTQQLSRWREGNIICATRSPSSYYSARSKRDSNANCITGYSACPGSGVCVQSGSKCPINNIQISATNPNTSAFTEVYPFPGTNLKLYVSRNSGQIGLADTKLTQAGVCESGLGNDYVRTEYPLFEENLAAEDGCEIVDPRYQKIDSMGEVDFLKQNNIYSTIFANPSAANYFSDSYSYSIYYRPYIQWGCDNRYDDFIGVKGSIVNAVFAFQIIVFVTICLADVYELFIMPYLICKSLCGKSGFMSENKRIVVDLICKTLMMIMCMIALILSAAASASFTDLDGCTDEFSRTKLEDATWQITVVLRSDIALFVIALVILGIQITIVILSIMTKRVKAKVGIDEENGSGSGDNNEVKVQSAVGDENKGGETAGGMKASDTPNNAPATSGQPKETPTEGGVKVDVPQTATEQPK